MLIRPRLVVPTELAHHVDSLGPVARSPHGSLTFVGPLTVTDRELPVILDVMTALSAEWLASHPDAPNLEDVATYQREPVGENDYLALPISLGLYDDEYAAAVGHPPIVDCEDASIADSAELRIRQGNVYARPKALYVSPRMLHIVTDMGAQDRDMSKKLLLLRANTWNL